MIYKPRNRKNAAQKKCTKGEAAAFFRKPSPLLRRNVYSPVMCSCAVLHYFNIFFSSMFYTIFYKKFKPHFA